MITKCVYGINGLNCPNCAKKIEKSLGTTKGIKKAEINFTEKKLTIIYKNNELTSEEVKALISTLGFNVEITR